MLRNRLYYGAKPYIPRPIRMVLRRSLARAQRKRALSTWPVDPRPTTPPSGWRGWPRAKQFAVVLTHDVEGPKGLQRVQRLAELEMNLGFRSSFNFVPEGAYETPALLRNWLVQEGFEVGVHDLHHDGKLLSSREEFVGRAKRINQYLREWNAVGFRAGFMLHNLEWFHDLAIQYDLSTFDTDPFEPQPDGARTIFPFPVRAPFGHPTSNGFVELPYTLAQDSTLFLVLGELSPDIWIRKTDWLAEHGGMVLVNVHPDYIKLPGDRASSDTYPVRHYVAFLQHLRSRYGDGFWHALPHQVAEWMTHSSPMAEEASHLRTPQART